MTVRHVLSSGEQARTAILPEFTSKMVHDGKLLDGTSIFAFVCTNKVVATLNASAHDEVPIVKLPVSCFKIGSGLPVCTNTNNAITVVTNCIARHLHIR